MTDSVRHDAEWEVFPGIFGFEQWNEPEYWEGAYKKHFDASNESKPDPCALATMQFLSLAHSDLIALEVMIPQLKLPAAAANPPRVLEVGCGMTNLSYGLAQLGCDVVAIDFAPSVVAWNRAIHGFREKMPIGPSAQARLGSLWSDAPTPGRVENLYLDAFDPKLEAASFDAICSANSLRLATGDYWRRSLARFLELLKPGGIAFVQVQNGWIMRGRVADCALEAGFTLAAHPAGWCWSIPEEEYDPECRYFVGIWPTG